MKKEMIGDCTAIYALCDGSNDRPRYVGKTVQYLHKRHKQHIRQAINGSKLPVARWLRKQIKENNWLTIKLLEYVREPECWKEKERFWIKQIREEQPDCLNLCDGGRGLHGHKFSQVHKERIAAALRKGETHNCSTCGLGFYRKPKDAKSTNKFCSRLCYQAWQVGKKKSNQFGLMGVVGRAAALEKRRAMRGY